MKGSSFFCEDVRVEQSGQPIFIGVLSPIFELVNSAVIIDRLFFVSLFYPTPKDAHITLELELDITQEGSDEKVHRGPFRRPFADDIVLDDDENLVVASLPIDGIEIKAGTKIQATLKFGEETEIYSLTVCASSEEAE